MDERVKYHLQQIKEAREPPPPRPEEIAAAAIAASLPPFKEIIDVRTERDFAVTTFSQYKKTEVRKELMTSLMNCKVESACNWSAEFICSAHFLDLWDTILLFLGKYIHLGNPKLVIYIENRFNQFRQIFEEHPQRKTDLIFRNIEPIRKLFAEIMAILCNSPRKVSFEEVRVKSGDFDMTQITDKLKADNIMYATEVFEKDDPKEIYMPLNEFAYHISTKSLNTYDACYWIEWIVEFEALCKKRKAPCKLVRRTKYAPLIADGKLQSDLIWIVWELLEIRAKSLSPIHEKIMRSIMSLFCMKYTTACCHKRRYLLYFAVALITDKVSMDIPIVANKEIVQIAMANINKVYSAIKKNEMRRGGGGGTKHSGGGGDMTNLDKSLEKMDLIMNATMAGLNSGGG